MKSAKAPVIIVENASSPMMAGGQCHSDFSDIQGLPPIQLVDPVKSQVLHQVPNPARDDDGLKGGDPAKSSSVQMIEMGVCDEDEINRRQMMQRKSRTSNPLNDFQPERPHWIHQNI